MSVFGRDSWAREAQYWKRRADDLLSEGLDTSAYKKLSNGKFTCFVCPHKSQPYIRYSALHSEHPIEMEVPRKEVVVDQVQQLDYRERQERELKFTAAGWKRDCHGMWFKDENVEFDSDEEDPKD